MCHQVSSQTRKKTGEQTAAGLFNPNLKEPRPSPPVAANYSISARLAVHCLLHLAVQPPQSLATVTVLQVHQALSHLLLGLLQLTPEPAVLLQQQPDLLFDVRDDLI